MVICVCATNAVNAVKFVIVVSLFGVSLFVAFLCKVLIVTIELGTKP